MKLIPGTNSILHPHVEGTAEERKNLLRNFEPVRHGYKNAYRVWPERGVGEVVYSMDPAFTVIKLPALKSWIQSEGIEMDHCLAYLHKEYTEAIRKGEIAIYSLIDHEGRAKVDIEVALTQGFGVPIPVKQPTVMQIRGYQNACPPHRTLIEPLAQFFSSPVAEGWKFWGENLDLPNFDGERDGIEFWMECFRLYPNRTSIINENGLGYGVFK